MPPQLEDHAINPQPFKTPRHTGVPDAVPDLGDPSAGDAAALGSMPDTSTAAYAGRSTLLRYFDHFASAVTRSCGSPAAFSAALALIAVWGSLGPVYRYSEDWQLVVNTGTTIVTFLMVFLIQQSQNKDSVALHLKLNELLAAHRSASNRMIGIETLDEQDLREVAAFYSRLAERAKTAGPAKEVHSIDEEGMPTSACPEISSFPEKSETGDADPSR